MQVFPASGHVFHPEHISTSYKPRSVSCRYFTCSISRLKVLPVLDHTEKNINMDTTWQWLRRKTGFILASKANSSPVILRPSDQSSQPFESFAESSRGNCIWKTLTSSSTTRTDSLVVGIATCPPNEGRLCPHRHTHAEVYYITEGSGLMLVNETEYAVSTGTVVYVPGNAEHGIRNSSKKEDLKWFYVFAADDFKDIKYTFSTESLKANL